MDNILSPGLTEKQSRKNDDLDSISVGTDAKGGNIKLYFNSRQDKEIELKERVDLSHNVLKYAKQKLQSTEL